MVTTNRPDLGSHATERSETSHRITNPAVHAPYSTLQHLHLRSVLEKHLPEMAFSDTIRHCILITKESLEPLCLLVWETGGFEVSTTYVVWTQLNTTVLAALQREQTRSRPVARLSEEVGAPGEEELKTQLRNSYTVPHNYLLRHAPAADPCSLALTHLSSHASSAMQDRRWTEYKCLEVAATTPGRLSEQGGRSGDKVQTPGLLWPLGKQPILHPTPVLPIQSEKVSRETQPSLGFRPPCGEIMMVLLLPCQL